MITPQSVSRIEQENREQNALWQRHQQALRERRLNEQMWQNARQAQLKLEERYLDCIDQFLNQNIPGAHLTPLDRHRVLQYHFPFLPSDQVMILMAQAIWLVRSQIVLSEGLDKMVVGLYMDLANKAAYVAALRTSCRTPCEAQSEARCEAQKEAE